MMGKVQALDVVSAAEHILVQSTASLGHQMDYSSLPMATMRGYGSGI